MIKFGEKLCSKEEVLDFAIPNVVRAESVETRLSMEVQCLRLELGLSLFKTSI